MQQKIIITSVETGKVLKVEHLEEQQVDIWLEEIERERIYGYPEDYEVAITEWKSRQQILSDIFDDCEDQAQQMRVISALDKKPSFSAMLDNDNYDLARYKMQEAIGEGLIIEADMVIVNANMPGGT